MEQNVKVALLRVVDELQRNNVDFKVTGGVAAWLFGSKRGIYDVDIDVHEKDIRKIVELFSPYVTKKFERYEDESFDVQFLTLVIGGVSVDVTSVENCYLKNGGKTYQCTTDLSSVDRIEFEGRTLPAESRDELIRYKTFLGRPTDVEDVANLREMQN